MHQFFWFYKKKKRATLIEFVESKTRISQMKQTSIIDLTFTKRKIIELTFALEWAHHACN